MKNLKNKLYEELHEKCDNEVPIKIDKDWLVKSYNYCYSIKPVPIDDFLQINWEITRKGFYEIHWKIHSKVFSEIFRNLVAEFDNP